MAISAFLYFNFPKHNRLWAFQQMGLVKNKIGNPEGLTFSRLMGTGNGNGFSILPDFSTYCLLMSWEDKAQLENFRASNKWLAALKEKSFEYCVFYGAAIIAKGSWSGQNPFQVNENEQHGEKAIMILTRASIKLFKAVRFWKTAAKASKDINASKGLIFTKGMGELPIVRQATLSVWKSAQAMKNYAYANEDHLNAIKKTRELGWYSEELFARFSLLHAEGNWLGKPVKMPNELS